MNKIAKAIKEQDKILDDAYVSLDYEFDYGDLMTIVHQRDRALLQVVVEMAEGMKKFERTEGIYCGCDGECFADCNASKNQILAELIEHLQANLK